MTDIVAHTDEAGNTFYEDSSTGQTAWSADELAAGSPAQADPAPGLPASEEKLAATWELHESSDGHAYYYNAASGETCWELPDGAEAAPLAVGSEGAEAAAAACDGVHVASPRTPTHPHVEAARSAPSHPHVQIAQSALSAQSAARSRWAMVRRASERFELGERVGSPGRQLIRRNSESLTQSPPSLTRKPTAQNGGMFCPPSAAGDAETIVQLKEDIASLRSRYVANLKQLTAQQKKVSAANSMQTATEGAAVQQFEQLEQTVIELRQQLAQAVAGRVAAEEEAERARAQIQQEKTRAEKAQMQTLELDELAKALQESLDEANEEKQELAAALAALRACIVAGGGGSDGGGGGSAEVQAENATLRQQLAEEREENRTIRSLAKAAADTNSSLVSMIAKAPPPDEQPELAQRRRGSTSSLVRGAVESATAVAKRALSPSAALGSAGGEMGGGARVPARAGGADGAEQGVGSGVRAEALHAAAAAQAEAARFGQEALALEAEAEQLEREEALALRSEDGIDSTSSATAAEATTAISALPVRPKPGRVPRKRTSLRAAAARPSLSVAEQCTEELHAVAVEPESTAIRSTIK